MVIYIWCKMKYNCLFSRTWRPNDETCNLKQPALVHLSFVGIKPNDTYKNIQILCGWYNNINRFRQRGSNYLDNRSAREINEIWLTEIRNTPCLSLNSPSMMCIVVLVQMVQLVQIKSQEPVDNAQVASFLLISKHNSRNHIVLDGEMEILCN